MTPTRHPQRRLLPLLLLLPAAASTAALLNGSFSLGDADWEFEVHGGVDGPPTVSIVGEALVLSEGDGMLAMASQTFVTPAPPQQLSFQYLLDPGFDDVEQGFIDAFEVHLIDAAGTPLVTPWRVGATAFMSVQQAGGIGSSAGVSVDNGLVTVDLAQVPEGLDATLVFVMVGADVGENSGVTIDDVSLTVGNRAPVAAAGEDVVAECGVDLVLDGSGSTDPDGDPLTFAWTDEGGTELSTEALLTLTDLPPGASRYVLTVTDPVGGTATDAAVVRIDDLDPPVFLDAPAVVSAAFDADCVPSVPDLTNLDVLDCSAVALTQDPTAGTPLAEGATLTITVTAKDAYNQLATADVDVTVGSCDASCGPFDDEFGEDCNADCGPDDVDTDRDGVCDAADICPGGIDRYDADADGIPDACEPACGNGLLDAGETCDDGALVAFDGCSPGCEIEVDTDGDGLVDTLEAALGTDPGVYDQLDCPGGRNPLIPRDLDEGDVLLYGNNRNDSLGRSVANAGDLDGDGHEDLMVGVPGDDTGGLGAGAVYLFYGPPPMGTLTLADADAVLVGGRGDAAGFTVAGVGDLDGDGRDDLAIGTFQRSSASQASHVYVVYGRNSWPALFSLPGEADAIIEGVAADGLGEAMAGVGDVDGDGLDDLLLGAPYDDAAALNAGAAYLFTEVPLGTIAVADARFTLQGATEGGWAGASVAGLGDVNGDGLDDFSIGAPREDLIASRAGAAYIGFGDPGLSGVAPLVFANAVLRGAQYDRAGSAIAAAGDVDGDGKDDIWVTSPHYGAGRRGAAYLVSGAELLGERALRDTWTARIIGRDAGDYLGQTLTRPLDANADGVSDVVIGAARADATATRDTGAAWLVLGPFTDSVTLADDGRRQGIFAGGRAGAAVAAFDDLDGDGYGDFVVTDWRTRGAGLPRNGGMLSIFRGGEVRVDGDLWFADLDGDGYGSPDVTLITCDPPDGFVAVGGDCKDDDPEIHPYATEGDCSIDIDFDCDGLVGATDSDADGFYSCAGDCDDNDATVNVAAEELCGDGIDNNCDGASDDPTSADALLWYPDADGDGAGLDLFGERSCDPPESFLAGISLVGGDCDDLDPEVGPEITEVCGDGIDNDCSGEADESTALGTLVYYPDVDGDGAGDAFAWVRACSEPPGHVATAGDCDDSNAAIAPGAIEICNELDDDCDGQHYLGGLLDDSTADLELSGSADLGDALAVVPDLDGDGIADLVVGAPDGPGAVYVWSGRTHGGSYNLNQALTGGTHHWSARLTGSRPGGFGSAVAGGDLNGDGLGDLVVTAPDQARPAAGQGAVFIYFGPVQGDLDSENADVVVSGQSAGASLGDGLAVADLDGDGTDDLVVGSTGSGQEAAWIIYGVPLWTSGRIDTIAHAQLTAGTGGDRLGASIAVLGDVDGDGHTDLAVGAPDAGSVDQGAVHVYLGAATRWSGATPADISLQGHSGLARVGLAVAGPGDVDGDGLADLLVGSNDNSAWLLYGRTWSTGLLETAADVHLAGSTGDRLGRHVAALGDLDCDGKAELAVGAPQSDALSSDGGEIWLLYGADDLPPVLTADALTELERDGVHGARLGGAAGDRLGGVIAGGDLNGDGYPDVIAGTPRTSGVRGWFGGPYGLDQLPDGTAPPGAPLWQHDLDADGLADDPAATPFPSCAMHVSTGLDATGNIVLLAVPDACDPSDTGCP